MASIWYNNRHQDNNKGDNMKEKINRLRSEKSLNQFKDRIIENLHGNWIANVGYDRAEHEREMRDSIRLIDEKLEKIRMNKIKHN